MSLTKLLLVGMLSAFAASIDVDGTCENCGNCVKGAACQTSRLSAEAAAVDTLGFIQSSHVLSRNILALNVAPTDLPNKAPVLPIMQKLMESNASLDDLRELLGAAPSPEFQKFIEDMIADIVNQLQEKVRLDQNNTKEDVVKRIDSLTATTRSAVVMKKEADESDTLYFECVTEEHSLLTEHDACEKAEAAFMDLEVSDGYCGTSNKSSILYKTSYTTNETIKCLPETLNIDFRQTQEAVKEEFWAYLEPMKRWFEKQIQIASTDKASWDNLNAQCISIKKQRTAKEVECDGIKDNWRTKHDKCLGLKAAQQVSLCVFGYTYQSKCVSKQEFDMLKDDIVKKGGPLSEPDRVQEWTHSNRLKCFLGAFKNSTNFTSGAVDTCTKTPEEANKIFDEEVGLVDLQDAKYRNLTSNGSFTCAENTITVGSGTLWTVPTDNTTNSSRIPSASDYTLTRGHEYEIESNQSKTPFDFCVE